MIFFNQTFSLIENEQIMKIVTFCPILYNIWSCDFVLDFLSDFLSVTFCPVTFCPTFDWLQIRYLNIWSCSVIFVLQITKSIFQKTFLLSYKTWHIKYEITKRDRNLQQHSLLQFKYNTNKMEVYMINITCCGTL